MTRSNLDEGRPLGKTRARWPMKARPSGSRARPRVEANALGTRSRTWEADHANPAAVSNRPTELSGRRVQETTPAMTNSTPVGTNGTKARGEIPRRAVPTNPALTMATLSVATIACIRRVTGGSPRARPAPAATTRPWG